jgi:putative transposase
MSETPALVTLSPVEREQAFTRFQLLQPFLEGQTSLTALAQNQTVTLRTLQRWVNRYRAMGLVGLARQRRTDRGQRQLELVVQRLIEGLALQKTKPSAAAIHRQVAAIAVEQGWAVPSYDCVYDCVRSLDPALLTLAQEGRKAYQDAYDLVYRREASRPNEIWQADHTPLNLWLLDAEGQPARPWLTVIEDDYSRCIAGYFLSFDAPNTLNTALALRQAIWRKADPRWRICGIPDIFYTDHGRDFTSQHMEQVCADLESQLIFSTVGVPRGRGRIERFFLTVDQLLLHRLPGFAPAGHPVTPPTLTLATFEARFLAFLLDEYHLRQARDLPAAPQARWEAAGFLPRLPESLEQLDLLLLTVAKARRVRRDGIHFHNLRYMDVTLAAYVGEEVMVRYDPRDMAEIRVYHQAQFICRAVCQELAGCVVPLKAIVRARRQRRKALQDAIKSHEQLVKQYLAAESVACEQATVDEPTPTPPQSRLKRYLNE